jgi:hypothetical protein
MTPKRLVRTLVLVGLALVATAGAVSAAAGENANENRPARKLVGSWDVTVTFVDPPPGSPATAKALATFMADGTTVESPNAPGTMRGSAHGVWTRIEPRLYAVTRVFFRFNPQTGAYLGTGKINATVRVAPDGETIAAASVSELRDPNGNVVASGIKATAVGQRLHVEPIADRP